MPQRLRIDWTACEGRGVCLETLPELIGSDDWGYPMIASGAVPEHLVAHARRAVALCPTLALRLEAAAGAGPGPRPPGPATGRGAR